MTWYDSDVALVRVLVGLGFLFGYLQMCTYSGLQTFCVCSLVFLLSRYLSVTKSRTREIHSSLPSSSAFGPPKCDVLTLWILTVLYEAVLV
jgi:hypothetical protein